MFWPTLSLSPEPDPRIGVVSPHGSLSGAPPPVAGNDRPVCYFSKSPLLHLFLALLRSSCDGYGRSSTVLGPPPGLRVPSLGFDSAGPPQAPIVIRNCVDSDCPVLASEALVSGSAGPSNRPAGNVASSTRSPQPDLLSASSSQASQASSSCLATLQRFARAVGFSSRVAAQVGLTRRSSSLTNYQLKWCRSVGHSVSRPSLPKVADFLLWLCRSRKLSVPSIMGYRSIYVGYSLPFHPNMSSDPVLHDLVCSFSIETPVRLLRPPAWDLSAALQFLNSSVFEPLHRVSLRDLTKKVLFLVSLATVKRVGELQAVSRTVSFVRSDYVPEFVAKTESISNPLPRSFLVASLSNFAAGLDDELLLFPVRALRIYLDRTSSFSPLPRHLFLSPRRPSQALSKNAISFFLREVIHGAGAASPEVGSVRAHSVRGVSTLAAFHKNWSVASVLESAT